MTPASPNNLTAQQSVAAEFDSYRGHYAQTVDAALGLPGLKVDFFTRVKVDYLIDILSADVGVPSELKLLDVGCGIGVYHDYLSDRIGSLDGVDVSEGSIEQARKTRDNVTYKSYNGARLPYDDNSFDAAVTICVMHHVPPAQWAHFMSEMRRVVKPAGLTVVFEHNPFNPLTQKIVNRCPFDADAVLLKPRETRQLMQDAQLTDVAHRYIFSLPAANKVLRHADRIFSRLPSGAQYYCKGRKA